VPGIPIPPVSTIPHVEGVAGPAALPAAPDARRFQSVLEHALLHVNSVQQNAKEEVGRFLAGEGEELHRVVLAQQRAELEFEVFLQVRNKAVQAYQEIMRMQL
jgi:flagellar hook-basal body complex protein FliE